MKSSLISRRDLSRFLHSTVLPDQYGGQFPDWQVIEGSEPPHLIHEDRPGRKPRRVISVGQDWLIEQATKDILSFGQ